MVYATLKNKRLQQKIAYSSLAALVVLLAVAAFVLGRIVPPHPPHEVPGTAPSPVEQMTDEPEAPLPELMCGLDAVVSPEDALAAEDSPFAGPMTFSVRVGDHVNRFRLMSYFVMPGEAVELQIIPDARSRHMEVWTVDGSSSQRDSVTWVWEPPSDPGIYCLNLIDRENDEVMSLNAVVLVPFEGGEAMNGYRIGRYKEVPLRFDPAYETPRGLVELTPRNREAWLSPHFQLKQFECKQAAGYPRYLVVQTRLVLQLETLLERVRETGIDATTFFVMSAYRTPHYNAVIGNDTRYSRHVYGDAADVFIDRDRNGIMDDLDRDGRSDIDDALVLSRLFDAIQERPTAEFLGGLGAYGSTPSHGPFVHVDARGRKARW